MVALILANILNSIDSDCDNSFGDVEGVFNVKSLPVGEVLSWKTKGGTKNFWKGTFFYSIVSPKNYASRMVDYREFSSPIN